MFKNNKGMLSLNKAITYFFFLLAILFALEIVLMYTENIVLSYETSFLAEKISVQGGLIGAEPRLPGEKNSQQECKSCLTNNDISTKFGATMKLFNIKEDDYTITVSGPDFSVPVYEGGTVKNNDNAYPIDYMESGALTIKMTYEPFFTQIFFGDSIELEKTSRFISEYIPR